MKNTILFLLSFFFSKMVFSQDFASWNYQSQCVDVSMSKTTKIKVTNFDKKSKTDIDFEKKLGLHAISATSTYGNGRVYVVTDSSPMDDGTGGSGNTLYVGWSLYSHSILFLNASLWLAKVQ